MPRRPHPPAPSPINGEGESLPSPLVGEGPGVRGSPIRLEVPESLRRKMVEVARQFRKQPTRSERILWQALRGKKLDGVKFRRQQPIGAFVVDFYASSYRLVVEVDGPIHAKQQEADRARQDILEELGLNVIRLPAGLVESDLAAALTEIRSAIAHLSEQSPLSPGGRGAGGEGAQRGGKKAW
ncbi:MAG: endonuclease domain-containing protein [Anaerolineales bacterium]|nr:endonuclease domain-containing protein [Anaerolineales bacterium]